MSYLRALAERALLAAESGDPGALDALAPARASDDAAEARASDALAGVARWWHGRPGAALPSHGDLAAFASAGADARALAWRSALLLGRASLLAFDAEALAAWQAIGTRLVGDDAPEEPRLALRMLAAWHAYLRGEDVGAIARDLGAAAAAVKAAPLVVEAAALRALAALAAGDLESARDIARRGSRMGRTEALPDSEYLANVVLARVRRARGEPHLAARILSALALHAPPPWHGWLAWELILSGGPRAGQAVRGRAGAGTSAAFRDRSGAAAAALAEALEAARQGARERFTGAAATLAQEVAGHATVAREAELALAALDARREADALLGPWRQGATTVLPFGLYGLAADDAGDGAGAEAVLASVIAAPGELGRRVLGAAVPLAVAAAGMVEVLSTAERIYGRTDAALSALALAGPAGMPQDEFFRSVYGFAFSPNIHRGSFNVLVHRMRNRVRGLGDVLRGDERLALRIDRAFVVPDPRCVEPTVARVLRLLASRGACRAEELAQNLNVSQRTVQLALQQLLADGACQKERNGREIRYRVDDTTFCEPTPWAGTAPPAER